eukprot:scaffold11.g3845.t1
MYFAHQPPHAALWHARTEATMAGLAAGPCSAHPTPARVVAARAAARAAAARAAAADVEASIRKRLLRRQLVFSTHARERLAERSVAPEAVQLCLERGRLDRAASRFGGAQLYCFHHVLEVEEAGEVDSSSSSASSRSVEEGGGDADDSGSLGSATAGGGQECAQRSARHQQPQRRRQLRVLFAQQAEATVVVTVFDA